MIECKLGYDVAQNDFMMVVFEDQNSGPNGRRVNYYIGKDGVVVATVLDQGARMTPFMRGFAPGFLQVIVEECARHGYVVKNEETVGALAATKDALKDAREVRERLLQLVERTTT